MQPDLQQRLASSLSGTYSVERELGGGGMSRVFVAEETALGRRVVVKVLAPEVAGALSGERFVREIRLAARLQQANIVPVLRAGELDGLPYYTMPFVAGESLRAAMNAASANTGTLGASQSLAILRDVARALAYAHGEGVVHRDIKPENVLLSAGTAVVTDFGIAKAISEARATNSEGTDEGATSAALTSLGVALGTPGYMAPEQAAGDPDTDARADLYAWGVMAYELLAGAHPFAHHRSTHAMLRAHMSELPEHVAVRARGIPRTICDLIMRCLAKSPDERPARASDLVDVLDSATTADRSSTGIFRALLIYAALFALVGITTRLAITLIGLPHWVLPGAIGIMLLGLPVVLLTGLVQRQRSVASGPDVAGTLARLAMRQSQRFTWRRAVLAGAVAGSAFVAAVGGFMTMRHFGIGPFGSLIGSNALAARDRIVVADMRGPASDTALGSVLAEGLRVGLGESNAVRLVSKELAQRTLQQMERPGAALTAGVARDVAARVQAKAVLDGDVRRVGTTSILTVRLLPVDSDEPLVSLQETADTDADFSAATGRLARRLRARIGESLRRVNAMPPLEQVTTASLPALRKYTSGTQAASRGDYLLAMQSYRDAIAIDSQFVAPYVALGVTIAQISGTRDAQSRMLQHAYGLRSRLPRREQLSAEIAYWNYGPEPDVGRAIAAAEGMRNLYPDAIEPLQALPSLYFRAHRYAETVHVAQQAMDADSSFVV
ncbi:MAG TPA: serine/threonine-protein kinase, partial [Gemmatimonadaceae bacterium]|nr:serine/threonine-protein kinase [Gemmatimonadaceae bacterium]